MTRDSRGRASRWVAAALTAALGTQPVRAEDPSSYGPRLVSYDVGALVALGGRRNLLNDVVLLGLTGVYEVSPFVAVVGSFGLARTDADGSFAGGRSLIQYDVGLRSQYPAFAGADLTLVPFLGAGLGARTVDDGEMSGGVDTDLTAYVALGARLEYGFANVGLAARDYVSSGHGQWFSKGGSARHDLAICTSVGVRF